MYCVFLFNVYLCRRKSCREMMCLTLHAFIISCRQADIFRLRLFYKKDEI